MSTASSRALIRLLTVALLLLLRSEGNGRAGISVHRHQRSQSSIATASHGVLQATTQVNDPALGAVPRIAVVLGIAVTLGGWIVEHLAQFLAASLGHIAGGG